MSGSVHAFQSRDETFHLDYRRRENAKRILDLGCGNGERAIALAAHAFNRVTGLDSSESLLLIARKSAMRRKVDVTFVKGCPSETEFAAGSFDEVLLLGNLFGHGATARTDVELLVEVQRILRPGGMLRLSFTDGEWLRIGLYAEAVESLPTGFIYRRRYLVEHGNCIRTEIITADESSRLTANRAKYDRLYSPRNVSDLLQRLGFERIAYDAALSRTPSGSTKHLVPTHVLHCNTPRPNTRIALTTKL